MLKRIDGAIRDNGSTERSATMCCWLKTEERCLEFFLEPLGNEFWLALFLQVL